ncbi:putative non-specific serine/threonine protein kinase [Helianthus debilis subsp. tardiflorus]
MVAIAEYGVGSKVSRNADMYSFGIMLLEMVTCNKPTDIMCGEDLSYIATLRKP